MILAILTDVAIESLIKQPKHLPRDYREVLKKMKEEDVHKRSELRVTSVEDDVFFIKVRVNKLNQLDFSVILAYERRETTGFFLLRRYNGKSHEHTNPLEGNRFRDFHIHLATERYQQADFKEECYAAVTNRYSDWWGALNCLIADCGFIPPSDEPAPMF
jgi:hypothetical protein